MGRERHRVSDIDNEYSDENTSTTRIQARRASEWFNRPAKSLCCNLSLALRARIVRTTHCSQATASNRGYRQTAGIESLAREHQYKHDNTSTTRKRVVQPSCKTTVLQPLACASCSYCFHDFGYRSSPHKFEKSLMLVA